MTPQELLRPRYRLYATYPGCAYNIGCILIQQNLGATNSPYYEDSMYGQPNAQAIYNPENYPNNFSKLEWWENRSINDIPEYLRDKQGGEVYRLVINVINNIPQIHLKNVDDESIHRGFTYLTPVTQQDYINYKPKYLEDKARKADDFINQNEIRYNS